jgi:hypothetical protein
VTARAGEAGFLSYLSETISRMNSKKMRFLISVEAEVTDPVAVLAAGVSSVVDTAGRPVDPYVPDGEFGLVSELGQTINVAALEALRARDGVEVRSASVICGQFAENEMFPEFTVPAIPTAGTPPPQRTS